MSQKQPKIQSNIGGNSERSYNAFIRVFALCSAFFIFGVSAFPTSNMFYPVNAAEFALAESNVCDDDAGSMYKGVAYAGTFSLSVMPSVSESGVIDFYEDVCISESFSVDGDVIIDGHGYTLSLSDAPENDGAPIISHSNGTLTVKNLTIDCGGSHTAISSIPNFRQLIFENVTVINSSVSNTAEQTTALYFRSRRGASVTLKDVVVEDGALVEIGQKVTAEISGGSVMSKIKTGTDALVNIYGGSFESLSGDGNYRIYGGEFDSEPDGSFCADGYAVVHNEDGTYSVEKANSFDVTISAALGGSISLKVCICSSSETFSEDVKVTFTDKNGISEEFYGVVGADSGEIEYGVLLAAAQLNDEITITVETRTVKKVRSISVNEYAAKLASDTSCGYELRELIGAMLDYGSACQQLYGYNAANPANPSWREGYYQSYSAPETGYTIDNNIEGLSFGVSLLAKDSTTLRVSIRGTGLEGCSFYLDGAAVTPVFDAGSGRAYIDAAGITPQCLGIMHTVTVEKDGQTARAQLSALTYAEIVLKSAGSSTAYRDFAEAMCRYNAAALSYTSNK